MIANFTEVSRSFSQFKLTRLLTLTSNWNGFHRRQGEDAAGREKMRAGLLVTLGLRILRERHCVGLCLLFGAYHRIKFPGARGSHLSFALFFLNVWCTDTFKCS